MIHSELKKYQDYPTDRIQVVNATEVIETAEPPVFAIRKKKDSSIVVGLKMVKEQKADAFVLPEARVRSLSAVRFLSAEAKVWNVRLWLR